MENTRDQTSPSGCREAPPWSTVWYCEVPPSIQQRDVAHAARHDGQRWRIGRLFCSLTLGVGAVLVPSVAHAAPSVPRQADGCAPLHVTPNSTAFPVATVYYVTGWPAVNVRRGPGVGDCIFARQWYTANVVAVPGVPEIWNDGYWWREVAVYRSGAPAAAAYSWTDVGWMAATFLHPATSGAACVAALCQGFQTRGAGWSVRGPFPDTWDDSGCREGCHYGPIWPSAVCTHYGLARTGDSCWEMEYDAGFGQSGEVGAATADPNWFVVGYRPGSYYNLLWQDAWWLR